MKKELLFLCLLLFQQNVFCMDPDSNYAQNNHFDVYRQKLNEAKDFLKKRFEYLCNEINDCFFVKNNHYTEYFHSINLIKEFLQTSFAENQIFHILKTKAEASMKVASILSNCKGNIYNFINEKEAYNEVLYHQENMHFFKFINDLSFKKKFYVLITFGHKYVHNFLNKKQTNVIKETFFEIEQEILSKKLQFLPEELLKLKTLKQFLTSFSQYFSQEVFSLINFEDPSSLKSQCRQPSTINLLLPPPKFAQINGQIYDNQRDNIQTNINQNIQQSCNSTTNQKQMHLTGFLQVPAYIKKIWNQN
jgi:hypothetical protein